MFFRVNPVAVLLACAVVAPVRGDIFELAGGGQVEGELVDRGSEGSYVVQVGDSATVELPRRDIARIVEQDNRTAEYQRRSRSTPDTPDAHRDLAAWCKEVGLSEQRSHHLRRLLELVPDDVDARQGLGFQRHGPRWMTRDQIMQARGMQQYRGRYRTRQEIALLTRDDKREQTEAHWHGEMKRLRNWLNHRRPERVAEARASIAAVVDPLAAPAVIHWLNDENDDWTRRLLVDVLDRLGHSAALQTLVQISIYDEDPEMRMLCVDYLTRNGGRPPLKPYVDGLRSKDNEIVNQAAQALGAIGDREAISPLIDALVTRHSYIISPGNPGGISAGLSNGGGGFTAGGNGPKKITKDHENLAALRALGALTGGQDFGYDEQTWTRWFVNQQKVDFVSARRDQ
ncbi:hypothetical protein OAS39_06210 [Pirellulales bacterium]|nr:hypothetical protein [Pirellulales bacterium]